MSTLLRQAQLFLMGSLSRRWPSDFEPSWIIAFGFFCLITFILILIWRRLKPMGAIARITSLAWEASGIPTYSRFLPQLRMEMASARRYQRPFSVAVLSLEGPAEASVLAANAEKRGNGHGNRAVSTSRAEVFQLVFPLIGSVLQEALRSSDKVTYDGAGNQYVIVFPQTRKPDGEQAVGRLKELLIKRSPMKVKTGLAEFPTDGLIVEDLVSAAQAACDRTAVEESPHLPAVTREIGTAVPQ